MTDDTAPPAIETSRGRALPLGTTPDQRGVNFSLFCRHGTRVWLVFSPKDSNNAFAEIELDGRHNRTGSHWHIHVCGLPTTFRYGWRVHGPKGQQHRYDSSVVLLDPTATTVAGSGRWGEFCELGTSNSVRRSLFRNGKRFDWGDDEPPRTPPEDSIVYELHVRGYTCHGSSGVRHPGTFAGLIEKIPYLAELGATAVELLPIHEFDECDCPFVNPETGEKNRNFWGYNSIAFDAPKASYAARGPKHRQVDEFRSLVKSLHGSGMEVILDVVFNHTAEGDDRGRTYSFRGLDNQLYYLQRPDGSYFNFTGCGNTLNCNHPVVRDLIMGSLRYWVSRMHVDGYRFDLASVLGRDPTGRVLLEPPVIEAIVEDGVLADTKLIAEPWDAAGLYQVGTFPFGKRWGEWNGKYRDDVRRFWRGDRSTAADFATRICGSADLYQPSGRRPFHSLNFITCHDGFTLWDLVSYNGKHNLANGEENRDGTDGNYSWNCGAEGPTDDPAINELRQRQAKNLIATLMLSQGVPMLMGGDEFLRTQRGNNNAWCQDNEISWVDWSLAERNAGMVRFVRELLAFRRRHPALRRRQFFRGTVLPRSGLPADLTWHGTDGAPPEFSADDHALAMRIDGRQTGREDDCDLFVIFNAWAHDLEFAVPPPVNGGEWRRVIDTGRASPEDAVGESCGTTVAPGNTLTATGRSVIVLVAESP